MADIKIVYQDPENLKEYQNNPRYNDDAVKISMLNSAHKRIHHKINWNNCVPKIISPKHRKEG